jgi:FkbM family methyltransferase
MRLRPIISRLVYYSRSLPTLFKGFQNPGQILAIFLGIPGAAPAEIGLRTTGWRFRVRQRMDVWIIKETCLDRDYLSAFDLKPGWTIIDIGAGLGDFTILASKSCLHSTVHAYEPLADSFRLLRHNLALNSANNVAPYQIAVSSGREESLVARGEKTSASTRFQEGEGADAVAANSLTQVLDRLPEGRCDLLKIDCEGCEYDFLLSAGPETLDRIGRITMETHRGLGTGSPEQLVSYLAGNGFNVEVRPNPVHQWLGFLYAWRRSA